MISDSPERVDTIIDMLPLSILPAKMRRRQECAAIFFRLALASGISALERRASLR